MRTSWFAVFERVFLCASLACASSAVATGPATPRIVLVSPISVEAGQAVSIELADVQFPWVRPRPEDLDVTIGGRKAEVPALQTAGSTALVTAIVPRGARAGLEEAVVYVKVGEQLLRYEGVLKVTTPAPEATLKGIFAQLEEQLSSFGVIGMVGLLGVAGGAAVASWRSRRRQKLDEPSAWLGSDTPSAAPAQEAAAKADELEPIAPPAPPDELLQALAKNECVVVLGSGMIAQAGLKTYKELLGEVIQETLSAAQASELKSLLAQGRVDDAAGALTSLIPASELDTRVVDALGQQKPRQMTVFSLLASLPVSGVVSLTFDGLAAQAFSHRQPLRATLPQAERCLDALSRNRLFVLQLNGSSEEPGKMLLSQQHVRDEVARNDAARDLLRRLFYSRTLLFLGVSLEGVQNFCSLVDRTADATRQHFALVEVSDPAWQYRAASLRGSFKVNVLPFTQHHRASAIRDFLKTAAAASARAAPAAASSPKLTRVELTNIGPFARCELELDPSWTVLLGDNGVGKSTILKAIAVCLAGRAAERFAGRLIKSGESSAQVRLRFGERDYVTTISQKSGGGVAVTPHSGVPIELQGVLAVGYSALRTSSGAAKRDEPRAQRPTAADLAPLTSEEADTRLDTVKQWIAKLDHLRSSASTERADRERYEALFRDLFTMFARVAEGIDLAPGKVDPKTDEITVSAGGTPIPFESLSQGTLSLIGWTGALLQRFYETAGERTDPKQANAIVLVDEIDAHMHPAWQQTLVSRLSEMFPQAQFIVTSHSPLVVGGLEPQQVYRLAREGGSIVIDQPDHALRGLGVAGLLTSGLFGLASQLDPETATALQRKRELTAKELSGDITPGERGELTGLNETLAHLDLTHAVRDPMYKRFVKAVAEKEPGPPPVQLTRKEQEVQAQVADEIVRELRQKKAEREAKAP